MRWYLDTEFHERGHLRPIDLISIALVSDDGAEYYAVSSEFDYDAACKNEWLNKYVIPKLPQGGVGAARCDSARDRGAAVG